MQAEAVVMGVSAGGFVALKTFLPMFPATFPLPIIIVQHIGERSDGFMVEYLDQACRLRVKEAEDKEPISAGVVYLAPSGYHLLIEPERIFGLSVDAPVNYSCPSIDVLFESAAAVYAKSLIGVVLTGASIDGAHGLKTIKELGGIAIVQNPETAESSAMPKAAQMAAAPDYVVEIEQIAPLLLQLSSSSKEKSHGFHS